MFWCSNKHFKHFLLVFRDPLLDPCALGRSDLDPVCGGGLGSGGGMVFDPFRSQNRGNIGGIYGPGGAAGLPPYVLLVLCLCFLTG